MASSAPTTFSLPTKPGALSAPPLDGPPPITTLIADLNTSYLALHKAFEDQFWATKMGKAGGDPAELAAAKTAMEAFLASPAHLAAVRAAAADPATAAGAAAPADPALAALAVATPSPAQAAALAVLARAFEVNQLPTPAAAALREELNTLEAGLQEARNGLALGWTHPVTGAFTEASGVQLRNLMRNSPDEGVRKAAYEALRSIGPAVLPKFCEIVKKRNALAAQVGGPGVNFYEMKLRASEGMVSWVERREREEVGAGPHPRHAPPLIFFLPFLPLRASPSCLATCWAPWRPAPAPPGTPPWPPWRRRKATTRSPPGTGGL